MAPNITSGEYATQFTTRTRDGKTYYRVDGWQLGRKVYRRSASDFHGSSTNPLETIGWCNYISESAYNMLSPTMKDAFDASGHRVANDGALIEIPMGGGYFMLGLKSDLVYDPTPPDPCEGVVCENICIGADKYSQVCAKEGVDAGNCILGTLIEENSVECGYVPPDDDEPDPGEPDDYIPPVDDEYPPKSELATDLSSIFGDIKPVHIIIAVLAMIFLGLLS